MNRDQGWQPLHPLSPFIRAGRAVTVAVIVAVQQLDAVLNEPKIALMVFFAGSLVSALYGWVSYHWTGFQVTREQIELKTGVLFRAHRRIPVDRIEAIDVSRPLIARFFGLVELRVEVVSGGKSEMRFQYLDADDAAALREYVLQLRSSPQPQTSEDTSTPAEQRTEQQVVLLEVPALHIGIAYGAGLVGMAVIIWLMTATIGAVMEFSAGIGILVGGLPVLAAIGLRVGTMVENLWGFRLSRDEAGLTVRRGLLNELTQKVPVARIQGIRIEEPLFWRPFGRKRLIADVAGYRNTKVDGTAETAVLAPVATPTQIATVLEHIIGNTNIETLARTPVPNRARWRAPISHRVLSIAGDDTWAISRWGLVQRRTEFIPHRKVQSIRVTQGPWQRRLRLASLHMDTAGSRIGFVARHRDETEAHRLAWQSRDLAEAANSAQAQQG